MSFKTESQPYVILYLEVFNIFKSQIFRSRIASPDVFTRRRKKKLLLLCDILVKRLEHMSGTGALASDRNYSPLHIALDHYLRQSLSSMLIYI